MTDAAGAQRCFANCRKVLRERCDSPYSGAKKTPIRDIGKSLSRFPEHPLMNRAMVAVSSHAAESPLHGHVHVCTPGKGGRCLVRCAEGTIVSDRVEPESDVALGCLATCC
jgi:hypothetical protein